MPDHRYHENMTLSQAQELMAERAKNSEDGTKCPCCLQNARIDKRTLTKDMTKALVRLACLHLGFASHYHISEFAGTASREFSKLKRWGLAEVVQTVKGKEVRGRWVITDFGMEFLRGEISVVRSTFTYKGLLVDPPPWANETSIEQVTVYQILSRYDPSEQLKAVSEWVTRDDSIEPVIIEGNVVSGDCIVIEDAFDVQGRT